MSTFTSHTSSKEIARNFFTGIKTQAFKRLREYSDTDKDWKAILHAIREWDADALNEEVARLINKYRGAESDLRFTVLRTVKTLQHSDGDTDTMRLKPQDLDRIDIRAFYGEFMSQLSQYPDICESKDRFLKLSPTDRNVIAEEMFRSLIYGTAHTIKDCLINPSETQRCSKTSRAAKHSVVAERDLDGGGSDQVRASAPTEEEIRADDSVSVAPSESISEHPTATNALNAQLLSLHNHSMKSNATSRSRRRSPSRLPAQFVHISDATEKSTPTKKTGNQQDNTPEIEVDIPSSNASKQKSSKFSRAPAPSQKSEKPFFFHSEASRVPQSMSTRITHF